MPNLLLYSFVFVVGSVIYLNTLPAQFTFDDNFALIYNGDVTNDSNQLLGLLRHDFWGQDISSVSSHKSYRPITVLAFRVTRQLWAAAMQTLPSLASLLTRWFPAALQAAQGDTPPSYRGLSPVPFHAVNVVLHGVVSALVLWLAMHMFSAQATLIYQHNAALTRSAAGVVNDTHESAFAAATGSSGGGGGGKQLRQRRRMGSTSALSVSTGVQQLQPAAPAGANIGSSSTSMSDNSGSGTQALGSRVTLQATLAAALFALHPVHTEAVAGVVGQAELISATFFIPAAMMYFSALGRCTCRASRQHWGRVFMAIILAWAAALSKETGITVVGAMMAYDLLMPQLPPGASQRVIAGRMLRLLLLAGAGYSYIKLRSWVAVDQIVRIYRKVENPIPFADSWQTRMLTTGYLHAKYVMLLLWPLQLSADWSFACVPLVEDWWDVRNCATAALYGYLLYAVIAARPWQLLMAPLLVPSRMLKTGLGPLAGSAGSAVTYPAAPAWRSSRRHPTSGASEHHAPVLQPPLLSVQLARWRLVVLAGLLVGPFLPAANVFFYVGTFIGERLLYLPSIAFCILVADAAGWLLLSPGPGPAQAADADPPSGSQHVADAVVARGDMAHAAPSPGVRLAAQPQPWRHVWWRARQITTAVAMVALLLFYCGRTYLRNRDWHDEEALFVSAQQVCPNSAKVQLNSGILSRRHNAMGDALQHFRSAARIEPGYCEPTYWSGLTLVNMGNTMAGVEELRQALYCKYVASDALKALHKVYEVLKRAAPLDPGPIASWGAILLGPPVYRITEGCNTLEDAAHLSALARDSAQVSTSAARVRQILLPCLDTLRDYPTFDTRPRHYTGTAAPDLRETVNATSAALMRKCLSTRMALLQAAASQDGAAAAASSPSSKVAVYRYIAAVEAEPSCRTQLVAEKEPGAGVGGSAATEHMRLLHRYQSADSNDPWLQLEWGRALLALGDGRKREAALHLHAAAMIFKQASALQRHDRLLSKNGRSPLNSTDALEGAIAALQQLLQLTIGEESYCDSHAALCQSMLQLLLHQTSPDGALISSAAGLGKELRKCFSALRGQPACSSQAAQMAALLQGQTLP